MAQEIPASMSPPAPVIPQLELDRFALHEAAALEADAEAEQAHGRDGSAFRRHLERQFGLTPQELPAFTRLAVAFTYRDLLIEARYKAEAKAFRARYFPGGKLRQDLAAPPAPPADMRQMKPERDALIANFRELLVSRFGRARVRGMEAEIRKRVKLYARVPRPKPQAAVTGGAQ